MFDAFKSRTTERLKESDIERIFATTENGIPWKVKQEIQYSEEGLTFE
jgi:hypothetical protein